MLAWFLFRYAAFRPQSRHDCWVIGDSKLPKGGIESADGCLVTRVYPDHHPLAEIPA